MESNRFARAKAILLAVADLGEGERAVFLDEACKDDPELRREIESMLAYESGSTGIILSDPSASHPARIGPYRILEPIGEGGMGVVYLAEQTEPVKRRVALKVIKAGMDSQQVVARFESERQALALMDHPAIAKVLDAGTTPNGRPFFAMDYVPGVPITEYCDRRRLGTKERLALFRRVCEGVQHAHQKAVIHRDLKPSNILVADVDGKPQPRIIDFGVAKATTQKLTEKTMYTAVGQLIGTPEYMSPEQADLTAEDVDTRTDVYSLGVILYELLAGALPFDSTELRQAGFQGIIKLLREKDPMRPSTKVSSLGEQTREVAKNRHTEPRRLAGELKGDLDWIVMRSLEKDRNRRYGSPHELAQDIQRHLDHQPVLAGPPGEIYRARKFVKRNRVAVGFATTIILAVAAGFLLLAVQNAKIAAARDEAESVVTTLEGMLASVDPTKSGRDVTVKEMLDETAKTLGEKFQDQPLIEARLRYTVGKTYFALGEYKEAEKHCQRAVEIRKERLGEEDPETLESMNGLAAVYKSQARCLEAEALARETSETAKRHLGEEHPLTLKTLATLSATFQSLARYREAEQVQLKTLEIQRRVLGEEDPSTLALMESLAYTYQKLGLKEEAEALLRETLEIDRRVFGEQDPRTFSTMRLLTELRWRRYGYDEAEADCRKIVETSRRVLGSDHWETLHAMELLGAVCRELGRYDEALALHREVLERGRHSLGAEHICVLHFMDSLARDLGAQSGPEAAEPLRRENLEVSRRIFGEGDPRTCFYLGNLGVCLGLQGRHEEAAALQQEDLEIQRRAFGDEYPDTQRNMRNLALSYHALGRYEEAEALWREQLETRRRILGTGRTPADRGPTMNELRCDLARTLAMRGDRSGAKSVLREALDDGYDLADWSSIRDDPDLASLHGDPEFEEIVEELKRRSEESQSAGVK